jgi:hypothetical protein
VSIDRRYDRLCTVVDHKDLVLELRVVEVLESSWGRNDMIRLMKRAMVMQLAMPSDDGNQVEVNVGPR